MLQHNGQVREDDALQSVSGLRAGSSVRTEGNGSAIARGYLPGVLNRKRLESVERVDALGPDLERVLDRLAALATLVLRVPAAAVTLVSRDRQSFKGVAGLPAQWAEVREVPFEFSFCKHVVGTGLPLLIEDARSHALGAGNGLVTDLGVRAYAGFPVLTADGQCVGALCVISFEPRAWTAHDRRLLEQLAGMAAAEIDHELELATALETVLDGEQRLRQRLLLRATTGASATREPAPSPGRARPASPPASDSVRPVVSRRNPLLRLWLEAKERRVVRVAIVYLAAAWLAIEVGDNVFPPLGVPEYAQTVIVITAALGFVVAVATAWAFDLTPGGLMRTPAVAQPDDEAGMAEEDRPGAQESSRGGRSGRIER